MVRKVEVSHRTIIFTVFFLLFLWLLYQVREVIITLFVGFIFMSALHPLVERLEKLKIPRVLAVLLIYLVIFGSLGVLIAGIVPPLIDQTSAFLVELPASLEKIQSPWFDREIIIPQLSALGSVPEGIIKITLGFFRNLFAVLAVAVIVFYLIMERKNLVKYFSVLFSDKHQDKAMKFVEEVEKRLGSWVRAQFFLMSIIGIMSYIGLRILKLDFALPLAVLAGLLEVVPNIGPIMSAVPAVISGFLISPMHGLSVAALYLFIQEVENNFIVPKVMAKNVGVNPLVVIIVLTMGVKLGGIVGIILSIPIYLVIEEIAIEIGASDHFLQK